MPRETVPSHALAPDIPQNDFSIAEAARHKNVSDKTIRRWIATGVLPAYRVGPRVVRIRPEDLDLENLGRRIPSAAS